MTTSSSSDHTHDEMPSTAKNFFTHFPWEKLIVWGLVLLSLWVLHDFLVIIFVTFVISYIAYHIIQWIVRHAPARLRDNQWFRRANVVGIFGVLLLLLYTASLLIFPAILRQGDELIMTIKNVDPRQKMSEIAINYLGEQQLINYKNKDNEYELALQAHAKQNGVSHSTSKEMAPEIKQEFDNQLIKQFGNQQWRKITSSPQYKKIIENFQGFFTTHLGEITLMIALIIKNTANFFVQFFIAIIFSFIIVLDIPHLKVQFQTLRQTRLQPFYDKITPGLCTFGDVMGTAFAAQAVIAICNTILTYAGMRFLNIPLAELMSLFVFFCSFIPVLGVFISSIPISLVALQTHGFILMLEAIGLIVIIHIFEAYIFNPRITGNFLKVHPLLVLIILLVSEHFFGVWGLLLGVPVAVYVFRYAILDMPFPRKSAVAK